MVYIHQSQSPNSFHHFPFPPWYLYICSLCLYLSLFLFFKYYYLNFIYFLAVLDLYCCVGFSLVAASRSYSLLSVCGLLTGVASLVAVHGLESTQALEVAVPRL